MAESLREEPPGGPESEAELSQRLARTKARSYGSTASVAAPLAERYVEHRLSAGDTLQGVALKYGVTVRRAPPGRPGSREASAPGVFGHRRQRSRGGGAGSGRQPRGGGAGLPCEAFPARSWGRARFVPGARRWVRCFGC